MHKVLVRVAAAEGVEGPVELRVQPVVLLATVNEVISTPELLNEHIGHAVLSDGHHHLVADLIAPAVIVEATWCTLLSITSADVGALEVEGRVLEHVENDLESADIVHVALDLSNVGKGPVAGGVDRVRR